MKWFSVFLIWNRLKFSSYCFIKIQVHALLMSSYLMNFIRNTSENILSCANVWIHSCRRNHALKLKPMCTQCNTVKKHQLMVTKWIYYADAINFHGQLFKLFWNFKYEIVVTMNRRYLWNARFQLNSNSMKNSSDKYRKHLELFRIFSSISM